MDEPVDLDDNFMLGLMQMMSSDASDTTLSDSEVSLAFMTELRDEGHVDGFDAIGLPAARARQPKRVRKGRRNELLELRTQVAAYKKKLASLLTHKHAMNSVTHGNFWQRTAHRIAFEKQLAVRENERLRSCVEHQMSTIKELQDSILTTITNSSVQLDTNSIPDLSAGSVPRPPASYASRAHGKRGRMIKADVECIDGKEFVCIHLEDPQTVPFNYIFAASHAWKVIVEATAQGGISQDSNGSDSELFGVLKVDSFDMDAQVTTRKVVEPQRVLFVWEMVSLMGKETGSVRFEPSPEDPNNSCTCVSSVEFSLQPVGEAGEAVAIATMVSLYDSTIGLHRKAVAASLSSQVALLSNTTTQR